MIGETLNLIQQNVNLKTKRNISNQKRYLLKHERCCWLAEIKAHLRHRLPDSDFPGYPGTRSRSGTRVMERVPEKICSVLKNVRLA